MIDSRARDLLKKIVTVLVKAKTVKGFNLLSDKDRKELIEATREIDVFFDPERG